MNKNVKMREETVFLLWEVWLDGEEGTYIAKKFYFIEDKDKRMERRNGEKNLCL